MSDLSSGVSDIEDYMEISQQLHLHEQWLKDPESGKQLSLSNERLREYGFSRCNLSKSILCGCDFSRADMSFTDFEGATIENCNFESSLLHFAHFNNAKMKGCDMQSADMREAVFIGASLTDMVMFGADIDWADFRQSTLLRVDFTSASLAQSRFNEARLNSCVLAEARFTGARWHSAVIDSCNMELADFRDTCCSGLEISDNCSTTGIAFYGAALHGSKLPTDLVQRLSECPLDGDFIAWKRLRTGEIARVRIPAGVERRSGTDGKCVARLVEVLDDKGKFRRDLVCLDWHDTPWDTDDGIEFWMTEGEATNRSDLAAD